MPACLKQVGACSPNGPLSEPRYCVTELRQPDHHTIGLNNCIESRGRQKFVCSHKEALCAYVPFLIRTQRTPDEDSKAETRIVTSEEHSCVFSMSINNPQSPLSLHDVCSAPRCEVQVLIWRSFVLARGCSSATHHVRA